jgi:hypothetical protein
MPASSTAGRLLSKERRITDSILLSLIEIGSFDSKRKPLVLFLGSFLGSFFHQSLEWFLFVLFLTVLAFTHVSRSLYLSLIGCAENKAIAYQSLPPHAPTPPH